MFFIVLCLVARIVFPDATAAVADRLAGVISIPRYELRFLVGDAQVEFRNRVLAFAHAGRTSRQSVPR